jgi:hypothetical protein
MRVLPSAEQSLRSRVVPQPIITTRYEESPLGGEGLLRYDQWRGGMNPLITRLTVKCVCASCNNGWVSQLEDAAKPVLLDMILDKRRAFTRAEAQAVARWATKTVLMYQQFEPARCSFVEDHYRTFYRKRRPLDDTVLYVGRTTSRQAALGMRADSLHLGMVGGGGNHAEPKNTSSTLLVSEGTFMLLNFSSVAWQLGLEGLLHTSDDRLARVWPKPKAFNMPDAKLDHREFLNLTSHVRRGVPSVTHDGTVQWERPL